MVPITTGQGVLGSDNLRATSDTGEYTDTSLILCAPKESPDTPTQMLQAQFVKYGAIVYRFNTPEELGEALFAIDPESTHDAVALYKEQLARDAARNAGTLEPSEPVPTPDSSDLDTAEVSNDEEPDTQFFKEQAEQDVVSTSTPESATSTPELPIIDAGDSEVLGTTTTDGLPNVDIDDVVTPYVDMASSTPPIDSGNVSSSTPEIALPPDATSTTPMNISTTTPQ